MKALAIALLGVTLALGLPASAGEAPQNFAVHDLPRTLPEVQFEDGDGRPMSIGDLRGKVVLLNLWATWCAPCREEMPTLDGLQAELGGPDFEVVALSIDRAGMSVVGDFYGDIGIEHLATYIDEGMRVLQTLNVIGLPTTLLIDREGREIGRLVGPAEWDAPEMISFIRSHLGTS